MSKLSEQQIAVYLRKLPNWKYEDESLQKTFTLKDFDASIQSIIIIAELAKAANHHPDLQIRYNIVKVSLTTHDIHGVTGKDFSMAQQIEDALRRRTTSVNS